MSKNKQNEHPNISQTILVIVLGLLVLFLVFGNKYLIYSALSIGVLSLIFPITGKWIHIIWFKIAQVLGWVNARILLTLIFFLLLFPLSLLARLTRKNPLNLRKSSTDSYFIPRNHTYTPKDLENPW